MKTLCYKILLRKEEDETYTVIVPSLPDCLTFGRTVEEAHEMAKEAVEGFVACMIARGEEVPIETDESMIRTLFQDPSPGEGLGAARAATERARIAISISPR
jgi:predicted RNase H-like HicB family nuclease